MSTPIAFIGLGIMGESMAKHLLIPEHQLTVYNRTPSKADWLVAHGARLARTPAEAADGAKFIFVCVSDTPDVQDVLLGKSGVIETVAPGSIVIDHSTISPAATREMAIKLAEKEVTLLDAPVSGGDAGARHGTLSIMVGGTQSGFDHALPFFHLMGKTITHCGPSGNGQLTKLVNQILVSVTNLAVSEAMQFAVQAELDPVAALQAVAGGAAGSWQLNTLGPKMIKGDYAPGFMVDLQLKDLRLVLESAKELGLSLQAVELVTQLFAAAKNEGWGREGTQSLFKALTLPR